MSNFTNIYAYSYIFLIENANYMGIMNTKFSNILKLPYEEITIRNFEQFDDFI